MNSLLSNINKTQDEVDDSYMPGAYQNSLKRFMDIIYIYTPRKKQLDSVFWIYFYFNNWFCQK